MSHLLTVGLEVLGGLGQQDQVLLRGHAQLVIEGMVPYLLHVIPIVDNAMLNGVIEGQDAPLALSLITHVVVLLAHMHHNTLVSGLPYNGWKHSSWDIISSRACLARARPIADDEHSDLFHCGGGGSGCREQAAGECGVHAGCSE